MARESVREQASPSSEVTALVQQGAALVRSMNDSMQSIALSRPRVLKTVRESVLAEVTAFKEHADRYYYSIPHRTAECNHPTTTTCKTCEWAEGASIHAAQAIARYWGNCVTTWRVDFEDKEFVYLTGVFLDMETNVRFEKSFRASKFGRKRDNTTYVLSPDKLTQAINAAGSKAQRNAILAAIPDPLKIEVFTTAKRIVVGDKPDQKLSPEQVKAAEKEFSRWKVTIEMLERKLGKKSDDWDMNDRATMKGIRSALMDGQLTDTVFGDTVKKTEPKSAEDLTLRAKTEGKAGEVIEAEVVGETKTEDTETVTDEDDGIWEG